MVSIVFRGKAASTPGPRRGSSARRALRSLALWTIRAVAAASTRLVFVPTLQASLGPVVGRDGHGERLGEAGGLDPRRHRATALVDRQADARRALLDDGAAHLAGGAARLGLRELRVAPRPRRGSSVTGSPAVRSRCFVGSQLRLPPDARGVSLWAASYGSLASAVRSLSGREGRPLSPPGRRAADPTRPE